MISVLGAPHETNAVFFYPVIMVYCDVDRPEVSTVRAR